MQNHSTEHLHSREAATGCPKCENFVVIIMRQIHYWYKPCSVCIHLTVRSVDGHVGLVTCACEGERHTARHEARVIAQVQRWCREVRSW